MDAYYAQQGLPYYSGRTRQRGSGIGAVVGGLSRFALPIIKNILFPAAKQIGRDFVTQALPEAVDVITKRKTPKEALKQSVRKTVRAQFGRGTTNTRTIGRRVKRRRRRTKTTTTKRTSTSKNNNNSSSRKRKRSSRRSSATKRSRYSFFSNVKDAY